MKELLYKKSEAVAALNRVDGFHPMELARKIGEEGQEEQLYLDVKYRKLWFRLVNPAGKIISRIITFTENMAVVEARIYLDKCDQEDNYVANSFSQKFRSDDPKFGDKFLEMAETAAVGRALSDAGYGVQFADVGEENDPAQVDAGIPYQNPQMPDSGAMENAAMPDSGVMPNAPMPTYGEMPGQPEYAGQQMMNQFYQQAQAAGSTIYHGSGQMPGYGSAPAASTPPKTGQMLQQEEQLYLDVKYRKLWFRLVNPAGKIISRIITFTENMAVVEARIYLDKCDQEDNYVANSFSQKFRSDDPKFGDKFLEMAETAAVGRALSDAGYGVQFADVGEENDPAQVDAGIPYQNPQMPDSGAMENAAMPDSGVMPNAPMPTYGEMPGQPEYAGQQMMNQFYQQAQAAGSTIYHGSGQMPGYGSAPAASTPPKTGQMLQGALQNLDTSLPVEELMKHMNYEMAVGTVIPGKGKYGGKTMGQVAVESPSTIQWFAEQYSGPNNLVPAAAKVILQKAMPMAG